MDGAVPGRALRVRHRSVRRRGRRGAGARPAGEARARGRLRARSSRTRRARSLRPIRGTTCSGRCTSSTGSASTARSRGCWTCVGVEEVLALVLRDAGRGCSQRTVRLAVASGSREDLRRASPRRSTTGRSWLRSRSRALPSRSRRRGCTSRSVSCIRIRSFCRRAATPACRSTLASDAHSPDLVGRDFDKALELLRSAGYETVTVFEQRRGRQEPLG